MADLQCAFDRFHRQIAVAPGNKMTMCKAMEAIRNRIHKYFRHTLHCSAPMFRSQGAYAINTLVNPISCEFNLNDGVYLLDLDSRNDGNWPTGTAVHDWLLNALGNFGRAEIIQKRRCVRVRYKGLYNVDLHIYGLLEGRSMLAVNGEPGWIPCDPHGLIQWFNCRVSLHGERLLRIIRYIKAWADFQSLNSEELPNSLLLSVLAARHYQENDRDDVALLYTFKVISKAIQPYFFVPNPVNHEEELAAHLCFAQTELFCTAIEEATATAVSAIKTDDARKASILWRNLFGNRFPLLSLGLK